MTFRSPPPIEHCDPRKAAHRTQHKSAGVLGNKAGQQVDQIQAGLHPQRFGGVGAHIVFQPEQHVEVTHQHVQSSVQEQKRHQSGTVGPKAKGRRQRLGEKDAADAARQQHDQHRKPGTRGKHAAPGGTGRWFVVKAQQALVQPKHAHVHQRHGVCHEGSRNGVAFGGQDALDDKRCAGNAKAKVGGNGVFHHISGKAFSFFRFRHGRLPFAAGAPQRAGKQLYFIYGRMRASMRWISSGGI